MRGVFRSGRQFTLIELLVVTAIVGILASFVLPALSQAKVRSLGTAGSDQERQIGTGFTMYADDSDGFLFPSPAELVSFGDETPGLFKYDSPLTFAAPKPAVGPASPGPGIRPTAVPTGAGAHLGVVARDYKFDHLTGHPVVGAKTWTDPGNTETYGWSPWWYYPGFLQTKKDNWYPPVPPFPTAPVQLTRASSEHVLMSEMVVNNDTGASSGTQWRGVHIRDGVRGNSHDGAATTVTANPAFTYIGTNDMTQVKGTYATFYDGRTEWVPFADLKNLFLMCHVLAHRYETIYFPAQPDK